jgi:hypothetical protein
MIGQFLGASGSRRQMIDAIARQVAAASVEDVERLVRRRIAKMGPCEARGYIRARAGREIRRRARLAVAMRPSMAASWETIAVRASDRIAPLVMRRLAAEARSAESHPHAA